MRHLAVVPFWGAAPKRGTTFFFEIADPEGALSVITGLITEIRHLPLLMGICFPPEGGGMMPPR